MDQLAEVMRALRVLFDPVFYRERYADIRALGVDPLEHYVLRGAHEGRQPCPLFDGVWYRNHYRDMMGSSINPLLHYIQHGGRELRDPHPDFDAAFYVDEHPEATGNPLLYHLLHGRLQGWPTLPSYGAGHLLPSEAPPFASPTGLVVDVVIPVYRGYRQTVRCIESVLADPERPTGQVLVVDDCSPEPRLSAWLRRMAKRGEITLLRNARNLGFVRSVNRALEATAGHDVVLLNSDTEVPSGWLSRLAAAVYSRDDIATASPFSNNATICSYPDAPGGPMPEGHDLAEIDAACRAANAGRVVQVPTTVGSCLYIRRAALDAVGLLDAATFRRGYGEEVDFCYRATGLGWRHVLACDVFVYHEGEVSFGQQSKAAQQGHKALIARYPTHEADIARHVRKDSARSARFGVTAALFRQSGLPSILFVSHAHGGGVRRQMREMIAALRGRANVLLLEPHPRGMALSVPGMAGHPVLPFRIDRTEELACYLRSAAVGRVHVHHLMDVGMDIRALIHLLDVPFDVTVHDYFAICPRVNFLPEADGQYCGQPAARACNECIAARPDVSASDIDTWRWQHGWVFREAERILCPSKDVRAHLAQCGIASDVDGPAIKVAPHEAVAAKSWPMAPVAPRGKTAPLRVVLLGVLTGRKGFAIVSMVAEALERAGERAIELHLIGDVEREMPAALARRLVVHGAYEESELPGLIARLRPHLFWFPAQWPETYSYTLSAAIAAGGAIAAADIGAFPERLKGRPLTWLVAPDAPAEEWLDAFAAARAALRQHVPARAPRRPVADIYPGAYLAPTRKPDPRALERLRGEGCVLVLPERMDNGEVSPCGYIRLLQPLHHPATREGLDIRVADVELALGMVPDVIVTQRHAVTDPDRVEALLAHCRAHRIRLVYDLDDDLLDLPEGHPDAERLEPLVPVIARLAEAADQLWVSTPDLAARLAPWRQGRGRARKPLVMPNGLDERLWWPPPEDAPTAGAIRLLCMGSQTHAEDLEIILPALARLRASFGALVEIDIIGVTPFRLPAEFNQPLVPFVATRTYPAFVNWFSRQHRWHIGLAPLRDTKFNQTKSAIKAMDYAGLGIPTIASDIGVYDAAISHGGNGLLLANDEVVWFEALAELVRDASYRQRLARGARAAFQRRFALGAQAPLRRRALVGLLKG